MTNATTTQQKTGFIMRPYGSFKDGAASSAETLLEGLVYSYAVGKKLCKMGYAAICSRFNLSRSTLSRKFKRLVEKGSISVTRNGQGCSEYTYELDASKDAAHVRSEDVFFTANFEIKERNGEKYERTLKLSEIDVLSLIYTHTWDGKRPFVGSHKDIAALLGGYAEETICRAVSVLKKARLIVHKLVRNGKTLEHHFNVKMKTLQKYGITRRELLAERKGKKPSDKPTTPKSDKAQPKSDFQKYIEAVNARSERERFYALRREAAQNAADRCKAEANKDKRFKWITGELGRIEFELAQASIYNPSGLAAIKTRKAAYLRERREILCRLGIDEDDLTVEAHCKCRICFDKGFRADGTACDCYTPGVEP